MGLSYRALESVELVSGFCYRYSLQFYLVFRECPTALRCRQKFDSELPASGPRTPFIMMRVRSTRRCSSSERRGLRGEDVDNLSFLWKIHQLSACSPQVTWDMKVVLSRRARSGSQER